MQKVYFIIVLMLLSSTVFAKDRSFSIPQVHITAEIQANGDILFSEARTYRFRGSFSAADYHLPLRGFDEISDISVSEPGFTYSQNQSEMNRTFQVRRSSQALHIEWFYSATSETRTFIISYRLSGALVVGPDVTEWLWMHVDGRNWNLKTEHVLVDIIFPETVNPDEIHLFKRGITDAFEVSYSDDMVRLEGGPVHRRNFIETRILFPTSVLDNPEIEFPDLSVALVEQQEQERREQEAMQEILRIENQLRAQNASYILIALCLLTIAFYRFKYPPHKIGKLVEEFSTTPPKQHPVLAMWLYLNRTLWTHVQIGAMFNLARLGYLKIREVPSDESSSVSDFVIKRSDKTDETELADWDKNMLSYVEARANAGDIKLSQIFKTDSTAYMSWMKSWKSLVKEAGEAKEWYQTENKPAMIRAIILHVLFICAAVPLLVFKAWGGILLAVLGIAGIFFSIMIVRRTEDGEKHFQQIKAYQKALKKLPRDRFDAKDAPLHLIYAIMFQLNKKAMGALFNGIDTKNSDDWNWLIYTSGTLTPDRLTGIVTSTTSIGAYGGSISGSGSSIGSGGGGASGGAR